MIRALKAFVGEHVEYALHRFCEWALDRSAVDGKRLDPTTVKEVDDGGFIAYVIPDHLDKSPYITRVMFPRVFGVRPFLHHIHRADHDRDMHDHPWAWACSLILRGSYDEERPAHLSSSCFDTTTKRVRFFNFIRGNDLHRITELHGGVFTLFVSGPRTKTWGFREWSGGDDGYWSMTPSAEYIAARRAEHADDSNGKQLDVYATVVGLTRWSCDDCRTKGMPPCEPDEVLRARILDVLRGPT